MAIFDRFMNLIFEEGGSTVPPTPPSAGAVSEDPAEDPGGAATSDPADPAAGNSPSTPSSSVIRRAGSSASGTQSSENASGAPSSPEHSEKVYREFIESLNRALEAENLPGFDFFEFQELYRRFIGEGKNEGEALQTALLSAETMRVTKNTLIANYRHYEKVMAVQKAQFEKELDKFYEENIKDPHKRQSEIDAKIAENEKKIQELQAEIEQLKQKKIDMGINAGRAQEQTVEVRAAFEKAHSEVAASLKTLVDKLKGNQQS